MRTLRVEHVGMLRKHRFNHRELTKHGGNEQIVSGTLADHVVGDLSIAHMARASDSHLKVSAAPIPGGVYQVVVVAQHLLHFVEVRVCGNYELLNDVRLYGGR